MSERILDLLDQARKECFRLGSKPATTVGYDELEKFAELIVRECADIAKHNVMNISTYADADFVNAQIKKHFGVSE
jgi:hypothetical protein